MRCGAWGRKVRAHRPLGMRILTRAALQIYSKVQIICLLSHPMRRASIEPPPEKSIGESIAGGAKKTAAATVVAAKDVARAGLSFFEKLREKDWRGDTVRAKERLQVKLAGKGFSLAEESSEVEVLVDSIKNTAIWYRAACERFLDLSRDTTRAGAFIFNFLTVGGVAVSMDNFGQFLKTLGDKGDVDGPAAALSANKVGSTLAFIGGAFQHEAELLRQNMQAREEDAMTVEQRAAAKAPTVAQKSLKNNF
jgi:hypothetical protein